MRQPDWLRRSGGVVVETHEIAADELSEHSTQSVNDPVWPSEAVEPPSIEEPLHVRGNHGQLDFLQEVEEDFDSWVESETTHGEAHKPRSPVARVPFVPTVQVAPTSWDTRSYQISGQTRIAVERADRRRIIVSNQDATNPVFLSAYTGSASVSGARPSPGMVTLAKAGTVGASREIITQGEIYCFPFTDGTPQTVDVQDEYGWAV